MVIKTGDSNGADGLAAMIRSASEDVRMPVIAAVELSGPAMAKGSELPTAITAARTADDTNVIARALER